MSNKIVKDRINQLRVELDWLDYNLDKVGGISDTLLAAEARTRMNILGKNTYLNKYLKSPYGINSEFQRSLSYNKNIEIVVSKLRENVSRRLKNIERLNK